MALYTADYARRLQAKNDLYVSLDRNQVFVQPIINIISPGGSVLDVGTGVSDIPVRLSRAAYKVWAIDVNEPNNALFRTTRPEGIVFITGDIFTHSFQRTFDAVIMKDFLEHFSLSQVRELLLRADTLLASRGLLVVGCPVQTLASRLLRWWNRWHYPRFRGVDDTGDETHQQWFTESALHQQLRVLQNYHMLGVYYVLSGVNNFPRRLILPLSRLQKWLQARSKPGPVGLWLQRILAFRIVMVLRKP